MRKLAPSTTYNDKFKGFNKRSLEYLHNSKYFVFNVLEGAVRSSKTVLNIFAFAMAVERSKDRLHFAVGFSTKVAIKAIFESDGLGLIYFPAWQGRLFTKALGGPDNYALILKSNDPNMPDKEIMPIGGGSSDSESSFRGLSVGCVIVTEANLQHVDTLNALYGRSFNADVRVFFFDFNPTSPKNFVYFWLASKCALNYLPLKVDTEHPVGYNIEHSKGKLRALQYMHCIFKDNLSLSPQRVAEITMMSDPNSPDYQRNVLGLRASGAGKIYHLTEKNTFEGLVNRAHYSKWVAVADPGISISETAFVLVALTNSTIPEAHVIHCYTHRNGEGKDLAYFKSDENYAVDFCSFIKECEVIMGTPPFKIICDNAAISFIREFNRLKRSQGIYYFLNDAFKRDIDQRIRIGQSLLASGRLKFHKVSGAKARFEFEDSEYDENKSAKGTYVRLDDPKSGKQIGLIDAVEYSLEAFANILYRGVPIYNKSEGSITESAYTPNR